MCVCYSSRRRGDETVCVWLILQVKASRTYTPVLGALRSTLAAHLCCLHTDSGLRGVEWHSTALAVEHSTALPHVRSLQRQR